MGIEERDFNYYFNEGDYVTVADDIPDYDDDCFIPAHYKKLKKYKNKIGIVKRCWVDLHSFSHGSSYSCEVDFDGEIVSYIAGHFLLFYPRHLIMEKIIKNKNKYGYKYERF